MGGFLDDARNIFEAALAVGQPSHLTVLVGPEGIRMLADSDWPLDRLIAERGADSGYRVSGRNGRICLEGRSGMRSCRLEAETGRSAARALLSRCLLPAGTWPLLPAALG